MKQRFFFLFAVMALVGASIDASATSSGIIRRATLNTNGCGNAACHGGTQSASTTVFINEAEGNKLTAMRGETLSLTLRVANATQQAVGVNIAVKSELNGAANAGTLAEGEGSGLRLFFEELTQSSPKTLTEGAVEFEFTWTAPDENGTYFLHAVANAVNRNGANDPADDWAFMEPIEITVSGTSSVSALEVDRTSTRISPIPAHGNVTVSSPVLAGETVQVRIMDAQGALVRTESVATSSDQLVYVWDGRTNVGSVAAPGQYTVAIIGSRKVYTAKAILVH